MTSPQYLTKAQRARLLELAGGDVVGDYEDYRREVLADGSIEDKRKLVELQMRLLGVDSDKDARANLATFNFVFNGVGVQASAMPVELVQEVPPGAAAAPQPEDPPALIAPSPEDEAASLHDLLQTLEVQLDAEGALAPLDS